MSRQDKHVVIVLLIRDQKVLMQLRDFKPTIDAPGCWGFFGGSIKKGEDPKIAAKREVHEELGYDPGTLLFLGAEQVTDLVGIFAYGYCCLVPAHVQHFQLGEGLEMKWVDMNDIERKQVYSEKLGRYCPIVQTYYIKKMLELAIKKLYNPSSEK